MTGLEIVCWALGGVVSIGAIAGGIVGGVRWIAETTSSKLVATMETLGTQIEGLTKSVDRLWQKSDEGEQLHRDHAAALEGLTERLNAIDQRLDRAPKPRPRKKR